MGDARGVAAGAASADALSLWPPLEHIEQLKAELARLRPGERRALERVVSQCVQSSCHLLHTFELVLLHRAFHSLFTSYSARSLARLSSLCSRESTHTSLHALTLNLTFLA
jgi:hypothetical protein